MRMNITKDALGFSIYFLFGILSTSLNLIMRLSKKYVAWDIFLLFRSIFVFLTFFGIVYFIQKAKFKLNKRLALLGFANAASVFFWYYIVILIPMNTSVLISFVVPVAISICSSLYFKEKFLWSNLLKLFICFGLTLISIKTDNVDFIYKILSVLILFIGLRVVSNIVQKTAIDESQDVCSNSMQQNFFSCILIFIFCMFKSKNVFLHDSVIIFTNYNIFKIFAIASIFAVSQTYAYITAFKLSSKISHLQILDFTRLPLSMLLSYLFLDEKTTTVQVLCGTGIIFVSLFTYIHDFLFKAKTIS